MVQRKNTRWNLKSLQQKVKWDVSCCDSPATKGSPGVDIDPTVPVDCITLLFDHRSGVPPVLEDTLPIIRTGSNIIHQTPVKHKLNLKMKSSRKSHEY